MQTVDELSRRTKQNAASIEETSAALEELSVSISQADGNLCVVRAHAHEAKKMASDSENVASDAETAMDHIAKGSKEIDRVTEVISISTNVHDVTRAISVQATEIKGRSSAVALVDSNTQKQTAPFEHVTAASHVLANEATELQKSATRFTYTSQKSTVPRSEFIPPSSSVS